MSAGAFGWTIVDQDHVVALFSHRFFPVTNCESSSLRSKGARVSYYLSTNQTMTEIEDEQFYRDTESIAFPKLDDRQLAMLEALGARRIVRSGELIYRAGQRDLGLTVVLRGELEEFESRDGQEQILGTARPRGFIGDVAMLMGTAAVASARSQADERQIFVVPPDRVQRALAVMAAAKETLVR